MLRSSYEIKKITDVVLPTAPTPTRHPETEKRIEIRSEESMGIRREKITENDSRRVAVGINIIVVNVILLFSLFFRHE